VRTAGCTGRRCQFVAAASHARYVCNRGACNTAPLLDRGFDFIGDHSSTHGLSVWLTHYQC
jgi:hypothetical protein